MNSKQLVYNALAGKDIPRIPNGPLAVHFCSKIANVSIKDYTLEPQIMADAILQYYERFKPDAVWVSADTWITAEAMGASVAFPNESQPLGGFGKPLVKDHKDMEKLPTKQIIERGRIPNMLEALSRVVKEIGNKVFIVGCFDQSPWSLVCALMGIGNAMVKLMTDPVFIEDLLVKCTACCIEYGKAMASTGADMLSTGDSPAALIGRDLYKLVALPAEQKVFSALKKTDAILSLHICGNTTDILPDMVNSGADVLEIDSLVDLDKACAIAGNKIALWGNLNPVDSLEYQNKDELLKELNHIKSIITKHKQNRFILSSGCTLTMNTNIENLELLCNYS